MVRLLVAIVLVLAAVVATPANCEQRFVETHDPYTGQVSGNAWIDVPSTNGGPSYTTREFRQVNDPYTGQVRNALVDVAHPVPVAAPYITPEFRTERNERYSAPAPQSQVIFVNLPSDDYYSTRRARQRQHTGPEPWIYDHQAEMQKLGAMAAVAARMYPNGVPQSDGVAESGAYEAPPMDQEQREAPMLIDGRNFDPMALESNQIAYAEKNGARDACLQRWSESVASIPDNVSFSRRERIVVLYTQDRAQCLADASAAQ